MRRTGYEHALWHLAKEVREDQLAVSGLVALWFVGWLSFAMAVFAPVR